MQDLFHGSIYDFDKIDVSFGRGYKDFGKGFYAKSVKSHAENIAKRNKKNADDREIRIQQRNPRYKTKVYQAFRYNLEFDDSCIDNPDGLRIKVFPKADREWVRFVLENRESDSCTHDYDIVIGPTADENTVMIIRAFKEDLAASNYSDEVLDVLISELKPENLPKQYFFRTKAAISKLKFKTVKREIIL